MEVVAQHLQSIDGGVPTNLTMVGRAVYKTYHVPYHYCGDFSPWNIVNGKLIRFYKSKMSMFISNHDDFRQYHIIAMVTFTDKIMVVIHGNFRKVVSVLNGYARAIPEQLFSIDIAPEDKLKYHSTILVSTYETERKKVELATRTIILDDVSTIMV